MLCNVYVCDEVFVTSLMKYLVHLDEIFSTHHNFQSLLEKRGGEGNWHYDVIRFGTNSQHQLFTVKRRLTQSCFLVTEKNKKEQTVKQNTQIDLKMKDEDDKGQSKVKVLL